MTTIQIIGIVVVALLGGYIFFCLYDIGRRQKSEGRRQNTSASANETSVETENGKIAR